MHQLNEVLCHFHVIQHVGKAVKKVLGRCATSAEGKPALDGQFHLFLRNQEDLTAPEEQSRASLAQAFPEINVAWQLKEALRTWYPRLLPPVQPSSWRAG